MDCLHCQEDVSSHKAKQPTCTEERRRKKRGRRRGPQKEGKNQNTKLPDQGWRRGLQKEGRARNSTQDRVQVDGRKEAQSSGSAPPNQTSSQLSAPGNPSITLFPLPVPEFREERANCLSLQSLDDNSTADHLSSIVSSFKAPIMAPPRFPPSFSRASLRVPKAPPWFQVSRAPPLKDSQRVLYAPRATKGSTSLAASRSSSSPLSLATKISTPHVS
ncbi:hypothetical protein CRENBAI_010783 [Crenichthys baileyi]|uniref:Uncharacterized protein n=1 Tax=Crenichthys baileyi TaxID=28760 RepID=A0AAV9RK59_9TELE